ncbi:FUN14 domain-containing protein [Hydrogenimonas sp.]
MDQNATSTLASKIPDLPYIDMGSGFVIGMAVGYFFKKSFKILLFLLGTAIVLLFALDQFEIIELHKEQLAHTVETGTGMFKQFGLFLKEKLADFGFAGTGSAIAGFALGVKMG